MKKRPALTSLLLVLFSFWLISCDELNSEEGGGNTQEFRLEIEPPEATLRFVNGQADVSELQFQVKRIRNSSGESEVLSDASWSIDRTEAGSVDASGRFVGTGLIGGPILLSATQGELNASATVTIYIQNSALAPGLTLSDEQRAQLDGATTPESGITFQYPPEGTIFARGLPSPEFMWAGGGAGDIYRLEFASTYVTYTYYTTAPAPSRVSLDTAAWRAVAESGPSAGAPGSKAKAAAPDLAVSLKMNRLSGANATTQSFAGWSVRQEALPGVIYTYSDDVSRLVRVRPGDPTPDDLFAQVPTLSNASFAWQSPSAQGNRILFKSFGADGPGYVFDLTSNQILRTVSLVAPQVSPSVPWAGLSPDGSLMVLHSTMEVQESGSGATVANTGLPPQGNEPQFAADGSAILYLVNGVLNVAEWDQAARTAGNPRAITTSAENPTMPTIGSFSASTYKGRRFVVYTRTGANGGRYMYLRYFDEGTPELLLDKASLSPANAQNGSISLAPIQEGGGVWIQFNSTRPLGNRVGTVRRMWISALDLDATGDPSGVPFVLPVSIVQGVRGAPWVKAP